MLKYTKPEDILPEKVDEIMDNTLKFVKKFPGLEGAMIFFLELNKPMAYIFGELGRFSVLPFTAILSGEERDSLHQYITVFEQKKNIEQLINSIQELEPEESDEKTMKKASIFDRIAAKFRKT